MTQRALLTRITTAAAFLALAAPAFAQDAGSANAFDLGGMAVLAAGLAIGLSALGCGLGQGKAVAGACEATARNPATGKQIFTLTLIGLAFIESLTIYALVIAFILQGKTPAP
jgi:F-type H+-transporting ATPase subunit c